MNSAAVQGISPSAFRTLDAAAILSTLQKLAQRVEERFPGSGLSGVSRSLVALAVETDERAQRIAAPNIGLKIVPYAAIASCVVGLAYLGWRLRPSVDVSEAFDIIQGVEAAMNMIVIAGAASFFAVTVGDRVRRRRALRALNEIRSIVHVIDMHQLTKDPSIVSGGHPTRSSPARPMSPFEVGRYLDYCSEMMSLAGKLAALYAQSVPDPVVIDAANDIEQLTANLSQKIWQKIAILETQAESPTRARARIPG